LAISVGVEKMKCNYQIRTTTFVIVALIILIAIHVQAIASEKISTEQSGRFNILGPFTHRNLALYLVKGKDVIRETEFVTLEQAMKDRKVIVGETGNVGSLVISSTYTEEYVFIQAGDIVRGGIEQIKSLIAKGADINARNKYQRTPLHSASSKGDKKTVELLLSKRANVNAKSKHKQGSRTPLFEAMTSPTAGRKEVVKLLVAKGAKVSGFHFAAYMGDMQQIEQYLQEGIDVNMPGECNSTALHAASESGEKNIVEFLTSKGALVDPKDAFSMTPLFYAACNNYQDIVDLLLADGADVNAKDHRGCTLLYDAVWLANKNAVT
jgi:hypothetical protein